MRTTLASYLEDFLSRGNETAFVHRHGLRVKRWSYSQIARTALRFARELEARRIAKDDRVLLWARNSPEWVSAFFGCLLHGVIVVPLDLQSELGFVKRVQEQVGAKLALCDTTTSRLVEQTLPAIELGELTSQIAHHSSKPYSITDIGYDDTVEIVFTSGTTAEPKGVRITHRNLMANLTPLEREIKLYLKWERLFHPIRFLNLLPLSHVFGQFMGIFVPQLLGGEVFFQESLSPSQIVETVKRERISVVITVPRILDALREEIESDYEARGKMDGFRSAIASSDGRHFLRRWWTFRAIHNTFGWKFWAFVSGGATLNPDTEEFWQRLGFAVIQGYGMTETASLISVNHPFKQGRGSIGKVLPGQEVKLAENGEILVRGENVSPGYWKEEGQSRAAENGWFRTGDVGEIDEEGNLYFKGRKREVIVTSAGVNIYPADIELVLSRQPEIKAGVVIEIEGPHGPEPLAVLILREDHANVEAAVSRVNELLAPHQQIRRWFIWPGEDFPRTATQKIRKQVVGEVVRAELARAAQISDPAVASAVGHSNDLVEIIARISKDVPATLDPSAKLGADLKLDSLGRVELLSALEDRYQLEIDEAAFTDATTLAEVEKIIREGRHEEAAQYPYPKWQQRWPLSWLRIALLYLIVLPATRVMGCPTIRGKEHLRNARGPLVFICNHVTMADHALVLLALPGRFRTRMAIAMDGEQLREWLHPQPGTGLLTRLLSLLKYVSVVFFFNVFSIPQKSGFRRSFMFAGEMMDHGFSLLVFPEGQRTKHGALNPFMPGTGLLIQKLGAPVVPMRIDGLWELKRANRHFAWPGEVSVIIGKPVTYSPQQDPQAIAADLAEHVRGL
ncbi:MAG TPA: AMP-binding protein [Pyrinomonadaceae bacterium]|nr:AMP-binding protein [Pyrinomonadaceae bacterium]